MTTTIINATGAYKFEYLTKTFFKGSFKGQVDSVYKVYQTNPGKLEDFRTALLQGLVQFTEMTTTTYQKLNTMGIEVPDQYKPVMKSVSIQKTPTSVLSGADASSLIQAATSTPQS